METSGQPPTNTANDDRAATIASAWFDGEELLSHVRLYLERHTDTLIERSTIATRTAAPTRTATGTPKRQKRAACEQ